MIGKIYSSVFPYYDRLKKQNSFKYRPILIIGDKRNNDYTVLPISSVSIKTNLDSEYDIEINPSKYPNLKLNKISYIRTHKQTPIHFALLTKEISDLKSEYPELFLDIISKVEEFNKKIIDSAL